PWSPTRSRGRLPARHGPFLGCAPLLYASMSCRIPFITALIGATLLPVSISAQRTWPVDTLLQTWPVQRLGQSLKQSGQGVIRAVDSDGLYAKLKADAGELPVFADTLVQLHVELYGMPRRHEFEVLLGMSLMHFPMIEL